MGLANGMTLLALRWWGLKEAIIVVFIRVIIGSILVGSFLQPGFLLSLTGSLFSTLIMAWLLFIKIQPFGVIGISIIGAISKNTIQLFLATYILIHHIKPLTLMPLFIVTSLFSGLLVGFFVVFVEKRIKIQVIH